MDKTSYYPSFVQKFERKFAKYTGVNYGITFNSGTSAIEAAIYSLGIGKGDIVIAPAYTIASSFLPITAMGAKIKFVDIDPESLNISPDSILEAITPKVRCILVVHLWGNPCDMNQIMKIALKNKINVIEDCSHAHGAAIGKRMLGSFGDIGVFSLQGAKAVAAGEGGIAVTNSKELYLKMMNYGHQGRNQEIFSFDQAQCFCHGYGRKYRAHPLGIALAAVDLKMLKANNKRKYYFRKAVEDIINRYPFVEIQKNYRNSRLGGFFGGVAIIISPNYEDHVKSKFSQRNIKFIERNYANQHKFECFNYGIQSNSFKNYEVDISNNAASTLINTEKLDKRVILILYEQTFSINFHMKLLKALDEVNLKNS